MMILPIKEPWVLFMCGIPGCGKSTFVQQYLDNHRKVDPEDKDTPVVLSTDRFIENSTKDYNKDFQSLYSQAKANLDKVLKTSTNVELNIIWDQTNLTQPQRLQKLSCIPLLNYTKGIVYWEPQISAFKNNEKREATRRLDRDIIGKMWRDFQTPKMQEGWDFIIKMN